MRYEQLTIGTHLRRYSSGRVVTSYQALTRAITLVLGRA